MVKDYRCFEFSVSEGSKAGYGSTLVHWRNVGTWTKKVKCAAWVAVNSCKIS